jgi:hypothetical protein
MPFLPITTAVLALNFVAAPFQDKPQNKAQQAPMCQAHEQAKTSQAQQHEAVVQRGDQVMGFSHEKTMHHFRLYRDGGAIEANANKAEDTETRDAIRGHFEHIVKLFGAGDFSAPMLIHAQNPPGTEEMKRLGKAIQYKLEPTEKGARIRITTKDPDALRAVHEFLRFQIADHQTGDSLDVTNEQ